VPHADPLTFLVLRYLLAAAILALIALAVRAPWPASRRGWADAMLAGILIHGGYLGAVFWAIKHGVPAGISALIAGLQPLVSGMLVGWLLGERVSATRWAGIRSASLARPSSSRRSSAASKGSRRSRCS
jgi:drug/metabolite transporter (DMT)-like permease